MVLRLPRRLLLRAFFTSWLIFLQLSLYLSLKRQLVLAKDTEELLAESIVEACESLV
jgi:hypothetical protein